MFGPGRDDWDAGERLYPTGRDDGGRPDFEFGAGHIPAPTDSRLLDHIPTGLSTKAARSSDRTR